MIDATVKIHDKYQLEIKLNHLFEIDKKITSYKIEKFIFIPNSLGIDSSTYKKSDFYSDIQSYIRFKTPVYLINQIVSGENSPYTKLKVVCEKLVDNPNEQTISDFEYQVKMFSCIVKSSIRDYVDFITGKTNPEEITALIKKLHEFHKFHYQNLSTIKRNYKCPDFKGKYLFDLFIWR